LKKWGTYFISLRMHGRSSMPRLNSLERVRQKIRQDNDGPRAPACPRWLHL
jgi:hypothetical protein